MLVSLFNNKRRKYKKSKLQIENTIEKKEEITMISLTLLEFSVDEFFETCLSI